MSPDTTLAIGIALGLIGYGAAIFALFGGVRPKHQTERK